ncbi:two-component sensor histidine kinase [Microbispora rosea subsp. aerata]|nr:HAMP domain-containing sensor histidine kinase [Microbispora rosea]GGO10910.1 two-component sensor histidine kinase [Microbispora rosea subsp. aerata]GIH53624.1 two-component sensor histidine kinase [Microbispora rosea subsp. aerata]GLJ86245.1 two-component sensor histidine kinase [Microbispora rosea subsp. aerata]
MTRLRQMVFWDGLGLRMRLTLLYGGLFFVAGSVLLWFTHLLTARALNQRFVVAVMSKVTGAPGPSAVLGGAPPDADVLTQRVRTDVEQRAADVLSDVLRSSVVVMVLVGAVAVLLGYLVADRALRPLDRVTETAQRLSESTLHERIALRGPQDEVKRLADTFDAMLDRLHRVFDAQRRFIANASHELRTPLAVNRTVLEVSLEEPAASEDLKALARALLATNARYERLIEGLLMLAQSEQEPAARKPVDLLQVVRTAMEQIDLQPRRRKVTVHEDLRPAVVLGDPLFLERCVFNLLENAIKYNVRDGEVWIRLREDGAGVSMTVENTGPVVPPYEVDDLFEPFRRLGGDRVRSARGAGLGLSIVRAIAVAHGGTAQALARPEGGLAVTVRLPK